MFTHPQEAYELALLKHGPVIGVQRKGRVRQFPFSLIAP